MEPNLTDDVVGVLHAPSAGIVSPYEMTFALAENAAMNGVKFFRNHKVRRIRHQNYIFELKKLIMLSMLLDYLHPRFLRW